MINFPFLCRKLLFYEEQLWVLGHILQYSKKEQNTENLLDDLRNLAAGLSARNMLLLRSAWTQNEPSLVASNDVKTDRWQHEFVSWYVDMFMS